MSVDKINRHIQHRLAKEKLNRVSAIDAAKWLDGADLLKDSESRPGLPLRNMLRDGLIDEAHQQANNRWFIYPKS